MPPLTPSPPQVSTPLATEAIADWLSPPVYQRYVAVLLRRVGMTRRRAECFVRLWLYVFLKDAQKHRIRLSPPLTVLAFPVDWVDCSCREAAEIWYSDRERGSDRSAGMMLDKLVALGLIHKQFDGNCSQILIPPLPELLADGEVQPVIQVEADAFDPRSDAVPIANLVANNYNWLNRNTDAVPYRIANLLRDWAEHHATGMRVLRRTDNHNPVGFYAFYPIERESEIKFFSPPSQGLHLSRVGDVDPFKIAHSGDPTCRAVFVRSWVIDPAYREQAQTLFLQDAQQTLLRLKAEFPNLCDMYTLIIHPSYEELGRALGFQKTSLDPKLSVYWMYQAVDRFLRLDMAEICQRLMAQW